MGFLRSSVFNRSHSESSNDNMQTYENSTNGDWAGPEEGNFTANLPDSIQNMNQTALQGGLNVSNVEIILEVIVMSIIFAFGLLMNLAILFLLMRHPKTRSSASIFIINLTVADLIQCLSVPVNIYGIFIDEWSLGPTLCMMSAAMTSVPYCVSFWGHLGLAICRYCYLNIKSSTCKALLGKRPIAVMICIPWLLQIVLHWVLVWSQYAPAQVIFLPEYGMCGIVTTNTAHGGYMVVTMVTTLDILIPFVACLICYVSVARAVRRQVVAFPSDLARKMYAEVTKYTTLLFGIFCLCWLPEYLRLCFDTEGNSPIWLIRFSSVLVFVNAAINPYIYALRCTAIRRAFIKRFPMVARVLKLGSDQESTTDSLPGNNQVVAGTHQPTGPNNPLPATPGNIVVATIS